ncbi:SGNH/GDSL hydrolase family protein [Crocosphaera sp. XPORK-15E]|uniref:SGNH/GDSL hydrolase family protein n=1 Tax=Crocosphaera sp. XPORK-15E TaxID=3110247 RepID=UPI002B200DC8|nr:SGNH/GDSL hydrolase family protein [Crocosphaera sp. XPORK-15E]MEA5534538.1 SGNH/GDSL hydrolase family protein [Crocosphaera sp. XPORK-15E]
MNQQHSRTIVSVLVGLCSLLPTTKILAQDVTGQLNEITTQFNLLLEQEISDLNSELAGVNIALFDVNTLYKDVFPNEFTNFTSGCIQGPPLSPFIAPTSICDNPDEFVYIDNTHPTSAAAGRIADVALEALDMGVVDSVNEIFIFGDSLSDRNNLFSFSGGMIPPTIAPFGPLAGSPLYSSGAFTNNLLWWENLISDLGVSNPVAYYQNLPTDPTGGINFALSGSTTGQDNAGNTMNPPFPVDLPGVTDQINTFAGLFGPGEQANPDALYVIWAGANNFLGAFAPMTPDNPFAPFNDFTTNAQQPVDDIAAAIAILHGLGARNFLIGNLFEIGDIPLAEEFEVISAASTPEPSTATPLAILLGLGLFARIQQRQH